MATAASEALSATQGRYPNCAICDAEGLRELRAREKKLGIQPDLDLDGYLKATAMHGQRSNTITLLVMRLLGLEVSLLPDMAQHSEMLVCGLSEGLNKE